jgi:hypothetical protein
MNAPLVGTGAPLKGGRVKPWGGGRLCRFNGHRNGLHRLLIACCIGTVLRRVHAAPVRGYHVPRGGSLRSGP